MALQLIRVPAGNLLGFKALADPDINALVGPPDPTDWSAVYPQLSLKAAVAYLPNQWERGHTSAHIVSLVTRRELPLLYFNDPAFMDGTLASAVKAERLRAAYAAACARLQLPELPAGPLMTSLGSVGLSMCLPDADGPELVLPHSVFNGRNLHSTKLFTFEQSKVRPLATGRVVELDLEHSAEGRRLLMDASALGVRLSEIVAEPYAGMLLRLLAEAQQHVDGD